MASLVPLIELYRGGTLECVHFGAVAVADAQGKLVASAGDPQWVSFSRSTLKALQALPFVPGAPKPSPTPAARKWASAGRRSRCGSSADCVMAV